MNRTNLGNSNILLHLAYSFFLFFLFSCLMRVGELANYCFGFCRVFEGSDVVLGD